MQPLERRLCKGLEVVVSKSLRDQGTLTKALTHRPLSSSFLWFIFRILYGNPKIELLRGLWAAQILDFIRMLGDAIEGSDCVPEAL